MATIARFCGWGRHLPLPFRTVVVSKYPGVCKLQNERYLFTHQSMKLGEYADMRERITQSLQGTQEKFRTRLKPYAGESNQQMIFSEDLRCFLHIMENTPEDVGLCLEMIKRFAKQNKEMRFGNYQFGPVVMRTCHHFGLHEEAFGLITDPEYESFFDKLAGYMIAMDLLYEKGQYEKVLKVSEVVGDRYLYGSKYPRDSIIMTTAACYKLNTKESYEYLKDLMHKARGAECFIHWRALLFASALALKQTNPSHALEYLYSCPTDLTLVKNLMIMALAELDRHDEAINVIKKELLDDRPRFTKKQFVCNESLAVLDSAVKRHGNKELIQQVEKVCRDSKENNFLLDKTFESLLCEPISPPVRREERAATRQQPQLERIRNQNKGLYDME